MRNIDPLDITAIEQLLRPCLHSIAYAFRQATTLRLDFVDRLFVDERHAARQLDWERIAIVARLETAIDDLLVGLDKLQAVEVKIADLTLDSEADQLTLPIDTSETPWAPDPSDLPF